MSSLQNVFKKIKTEKNNYVFNIKNNNKISYENLYINSLSKFSFLSGFKQKKILVVVNNSIDYLEILIATILSGNIFCPIPYFTSIQEIEKTCTYLKPKLIISDKDLDLKINKKTKIYHLHHLIKKNNNFVFNAVKNKDVASIYYSSGTTSDPKGVIYSHQNIFYLINSINKDFKFSRKSKHLVCLPFGHTASINYSIFPSLFLRSSMYIAENFLEISNKFFSLISLYKITYIQIVPTIAIMLLKIKEQTTNLNLKTLKYIGCGSSTLPKEIQDQFYKQFKINLANLYGLSETGPSHYDNPLLSSWKTGYIGKPLSVNKCKIARDGEILLKGKNIFIGYHKNKRLYNKVVSKGWFKTGDLGIKISQNLFKFIDRKKDLIIKGGINIIPAEIEEYIYHFEEVKEVAVVGINDSINGEEVYSCITLKKYKNYQKVINKINAYLKIKLSSFKVPKKLIIIDEMPLTKSGKIKRKDAKKIVEKKLNFDSHE